MSEFQKLVNRLAALKLSPKHQTRLDSISSTSDKFMYARSFLGYRSRVYIDKPYTRYVAPSSSIKHLFERLKNKSNNHTPWSKKRFVGIEIECIIPERALAGLKALPIIGTTIKSDGSLRRNSELDKPEPLQGIRYSTIEITMLMPQGDYSKLSRMLEYLNSNGAYVNESCGLHVHLDQRHNDKKAAMQCYSRLQNALAPMLSKLVDQERLTTDDRTNYAMLSKNAKNKYQAVNFLPYKTRKTIEVRLHHGSLDLNEITQWIETLISVSEVKGLVRPKKQKTWDEVLALVPLSAEKKAILAERAKRKMEANKALEMVSE